MQQEDEYAAARAAHVETARRALRRHRGRPVLSHETAAIVHGLAVYAIPAKVRLTRADGSRRSGGRTLVNVAELPPADVVEIDGMLVTSAARTVIDIARSRPFMQALVTADAALRAGLRRDALEQILLRIWHWPGIRPAKAVVRWADGNAESANESIVRARCILLGLPVPELQVWIRLTRTYSVRVDFYWKEHGLVGEADGRVKYTTQDVLWREKKRRDQIEERHSMIRWTWAQAHAPDAEFRRRLMEAFAHGDRLKRLLE